MQGQWKPSFYECVVTRPGYPRGRKTYPPMMRTRFGASRVPKHLSPRIYLRQFPVRVFEHLRTQAESICYFVFSVYGLHSSRDWLVQFFTVVWLREARVSTFSSSGRRDFLQIYHSFEYHFFTTKNSKVFFVFFLYRGL